MIAISQPSAKKLGDWLARANNTVYEAATDGFVVAGGSVAWPDFPIIKTDSANPPVTQRCKNNCSNNPEAGIFTPVRKDDFWKVENCDDYVYWIPWE